MKRLVYSPYIQAFIKADDGVVDVSPYIVRGSVNRKVNQVSGAQLTLRNPVQGSTSQLLFTEYLGPKGADDPHPMIHPMDPIVIVMQRLQGHPVQVFTGYVDKAPYFQLYPGLCTLEASCTLKRLLYTQWDAALPAVQDFLAQFGWIPNGNGIWNPGSEASRINVNAGQLNGQFSDGSIGALLFAVLNIMGTWDHTTIWIEALPPEIKDIVLNLYKQIEPTVQQGEAQFQSLIQTILGSTSQGSGGNGSSSDGVGATANVAIAIPAMIQAANNNGVDPLFVLALSYNECGFSASEVNGWSPTDDTGWFQFHFGAGNHNGHSQPYGQGSYTVTQARDPGFAADVFCKEGVKSKGGGLPANQSDWEAFATRIQVSVGYPSWDSNMPTVQQFYDKYKNAPPPGGTSNMQGASNSSLAPADNSSSTSGTTTAQMPGTSPGGKSGGRSGAKTNSNGMINPIPGFTGFTYDYGIDASAPTGSAVLAPAGCTVAQWIPNFYREAGDGSGGLLLLLFDTQPPGAPSAYWYISEHVLMSSTTQGHHFNQGDTVATFGGQGGGNGIEIGWGTAPGGDPRYGAAQGIPDHTSGIWGQRFRDYFSIGGGSPQQGGATGGGTTGGQGGNTMAAAFSTFINLPSIFSMAEAVVFTGKRSFIADQPLFPFIEQLCKASLRNFMSMPNGNFFAFFPDYFGLFGRKYYWEIRDIEIIDGRIDLSDDALLTHVAVAGDVTQYHGTVDFTDLVLTSGIFDIFDAFATGYIGGSRDIGTKIDPKKFEVPKGKAAALAFLQKYGARPYVEEVPAIRSPFFELFLAFQNFMIAWSKQFQTTFELTFMPELFPGGLIALPDHHLQCYVEEVQHNFDYEQGFTTTVALSSPSQLASDPRSRKNLSEGPARPALTSAQQGAERFGKAKTRQLIARGS